MTEKSSSPIVINIEAFSELLEEAAKISGTFYRAVTADRAKQDSVLSIEGSFKTGGRLYPSGKPIFQVCAVDVILLGKMSAHGRSMYASRGGRNEQESEAT